MSTLIRTFLAFSLVLTLIAGFWLISYTPTLNIGGAASTIDITGELTTSDGQSQAADIILKNPAFPEVRDFILEDPTSRNEFVLNQYECRHFATAVDNNAESNGLRCAFVLLCFKRGQHAVIAFDTPDRGLIFIEPQTDAVIHPEVGGKYQGQEITEILIAW